jgi:hypothetical protein
MRLGRAAEVGDGKLHGVRKQLATLPLLEVLASFNRSAEDWLCQPRHT